MKVIGAIFLLVILSVTATDVPCPGGQHSCPDTATCCPLADQSYGCCTEKNAVCCDDHIHCCPSGTHCDSNICIKSNSNTSVAAQNYKNVCPGGQFSCPDQSTCCLNSEGQVQGCCLMPDAICCEDGQHCCPKNTRCNLKTLQCIANGYVLQMYDSQKFQPDIESNSIEFDDLPPVVNSPDYKATKISSVKVFSIVCPGGTSQCPDGYTCCLLPSQKWGCCPYPEATCCPDMQHCCPNGMKCDSTSQACIQGLRNITWSANIPAQSIP